MQEEAVPRSVSLSVAAKARAVSFAEELEHPSSPSPVEEEEEEATPASPPTAAPPPPTTATARPPAVDTTRVEFISASPAPSTPSTPPTASTAAGGVFRQGMLNMDLEACLGFVRNLNLSPKTKTLPAEKDVLVLRRLLANSSSRVRGAALRALRFVVQVPNTGIAMLNAHRIHLLACRCLEREKFLEERVQALKLFRAISCFAADKMPRTLLRSVVAIAAHRDDALKEACLESLREFALVNTKAVAECNGIAAMVNAVIDPNMAHLADSLLLTILHLLGQHQTRIWLRPSLDLAVLLAPFTSTSESQEDAEVQRQRRKLSQKAIATMMRTWTGLFILASDPHGLRSLVQMLVQPVSLDLRKDVLDTILLVFHTVNPLRSRSYGSAHNDNKERASSDSPGDSFRAGSFDLYDDFFPAPDANNGGGASGAGAAAAAAAAGGEDGNGIYGSEPYLAEYWGVGPGASGAKELSSGGFHTERVPGRHVHTHHLMDNFLVMVLLAFVQCGLVEALVELAVSSSEPVNRTATQLLSFVTRFSTRLLPKEVSRRLLSQKKLVASAVDAARAGEVVDRARAQRAAHVIGLLSRIVGSGYDTALATLLARSTYEDGIALASELAMSNERVHINSGVFPKTQVVSKRTIVELLTTQQPRMMSPDHGLGGSGNHHSGHRSGSVTMLTSLKKMGRRLTLTSQPGGLNGGGGGLAASGLLNGQFGGGLGIFVPELDGSPQAEDAPHQGRSHHPLVANRGHRKLVLQLVLTDSCNFQPTKTHSLEHEVKRVLDKCRIMLKPERRNWKSWDWVAIDETLNGPCQNQHMFSEVLKTKFFKRLSAFYSVSATSGPFCQMKWDADCLSYTLVCVSMCKLLLNSAKQDHEAVNDILTVDRRGRLVGQIADSLLVELSHALGEDLNTPSLDQQAQAGGGGGGGGGVGGGEQLRSYIQQQHVQGHFPTLGATTTAAAAAFDDDELGGEEDDFDRTQTNLRVFTSHACSTTMAREFFVILGVFAASKTGLHLLDELNVFNTMTKLSLHREKDYLLRLFIANLDYSGPIDRPREWLQLVLMNSKISMDLRTFCLGFFRSLLRVNLTRGIAEWLLNMIFAQLPTAEVRANAISVLVEACHYPLYLDLVCELAFSGPNVPFHYDTDAELVLKLLAKEGGVHHMRKLGWLDAMFANWKKPGGGYVAYLNQIDRALLSQLYEDTSSLYRAIPVRSHESDALSEPGFASSDLQFLFKLPWKIEVCADSSLGTVKVAMDCFIDLSWYKPNEAKDAHNGSNGSAATTAGGEVRGICITAVPPWSRDKDGDKRQRARPFIVPEDSTLYASLAMGGSPVDRRGRVHSAPVTGGLGFQFTFPREGGAQAPAAATATAATAKPSKIRHRTSKLNMNFNPRASGAYSVDNNGGGGGDEMFDKPFAEAAHGGDVGVEYSTSLSDERFWSKCQPQDRKLALKQANDNYAKAPFRQANPVMPGSSFPFSPSNSPALFKFSTLEAQHRESFGGGSQSRGEATNDHLSSSGNEPEVRYVNPLIALRSANRNNSVEQVPRSPRSKASTQHGGGGEDLPPLLVLKEVRFYLELVPERSATPSIPVHLLGELAKTAAGAQEITNQNLFKYFVGKVKDVGEANVERRAALWALGHIGGASELGFERMQSTEPTIVKIISQVATEASCLSLRGTACYTLGLFSRHRMGAHALNKIGWATLEFRSHPFASIAVPNNHSGAFAFHLPGGRSTHLDVTASLSCSVDAMGEEGGKVESTLLTTPEAWRVYHLISDLSNHIAQKDAHAELSKVKEQTPLVFADVKLYLAVHDLLARFNYELAVRQYVLGLFHTKISFENEQTWQQIDLEALH